MAIVDPWTARKFPPKFSAECILYLRFPSPSLFHIPQESSFSVLSAGKWSFSTQREQTHANTLPCSFVSCGWVFRRTSFKHVPTLVHLLVLQLCEYPLKPVIFALSPPFSFPLSFLLFSPTASLHPFTHPDARLCGVVLNRPRASILCLKHWLTRSD